MKLIRFTEHPGLAAVFTGLAEGDFARAGRQEMADAAVARVASSLGFRPHDVRRMSQVHSADVALVESDPGAVAPEVDAMVDPTASAVPMVLTADCVPVVFAARRPDGSSLTAVAHAGRKGLLAGVLSETVAVVQEHGGDAIEAWIGPSICGECYEVPEDMAQAAESVRPGIAATTSWGTASLDLPGAAQRELECLGVRTHRVECCTLTDPDYHSYRGGDLRARNASMVIRLAAPTP